jgi:hypothetical protein
VGSICLFMCGQHLRTLRYLPPSLLISPGQAANARHAALGSSVCPLNIHHAFRFVFLSISFRPPSGAAKLISVIRSGGAPPTLHPHSRLAQPACSACWLRSSPGMLIPFDRCYCLLNSEVACDPSIAHVYKLARLGLTSRGGTIKYKPSMRLLLFISTQTAPGQS